MNSPSGTRPGPGAGTNRINNINSNRESPTQQQIVGISGVARNKQEGAVQAFKIANEAASYLNGNLTDVNSNSGGGINVGKNRNVAVSNKRQPNNNL